MEQIGTFVITHWPLFVALVVVLALLAGTSMGAGLQGVRQVDPLEATQLVNHRGGIFLDIRAAEEYRQGHVVNTLHVPLGKLSDSLKPLEKYRSKPIITVCRSGARSGQACRVLRRHGFENVYNLKGGMQAWTAANMPITTKG
jgi:rhodanese-related sulfurtransferase